jgi:hypothetical protein
VGPGQQQVSGWVAWFFNLLSAAKENQTGLGRIKNAALTCMVFLNPKASY